MTTTGKIDENLLSRRDFMVLTGLATAGTLAGCATNPVTGKKQLMLMSESDEIGVDKQYAPHQFSSDYGAVQDSLLNDYLAGVGKKVAAISHRPQMPFSFRGVNATYVNAYAFPGGSIAATRGILLELDNEAELAGLLGHEIGHVCARHTADRMTKTMLAQVVVVGLTIYAASENEKYAPIAAGLGGIGAGALLARYSRDDERQADSLGMEYMVKAGLNPNGMVGLMDVLRSMSTHKPNVIERMFSSHPMSDERYKKAVEAVQGKYKPHEGSSINRESYMDHTANLRKIKGAIEKLQVGEREMLNKKYPAAEQQFQQALKEAPADYVGLVMMSKLQLAQKKNEEAIRYAEEAKQVYPQEAQAWHIGGMAKMEMKRYDAALADFNAYEKKLPGNPNTTFYRGFAFEGMNKRNRAIEHYQNFLKMVDSGDQAKHAHTRLVEWGVITEQTQQQGS